MNGATFEDIEDHDGACKALGASAPRPATPTFNFQLSHRGTNIRRSLLLERMALEPHRGDANCGSHLGSLHPIEGA